VAFAPGSLIPSIYLAAPAETEELAAGRVEACDRGIAREQWSANPSRGWARPQDGVGAERRLPVGRLDQPLGTAGDATSVKLAGGAVVLEWGGGIAITTSSVSIAMARRCHRSRLRVSPEASSAALRVQACGVVSGSRCATR
jgi:hypothetical protein